MRKAEDILKDMAFNKDAPESTKDALLKNLRKAMKESEKGEVVPVSSATPKPRKGKTLITDTQLSFDLGPKDYKKAR